MGACIAAAVGLFFGAIGLWKLVRVRRARRGQAPQGEKQPAAVTRMDAIMYRETAESRLGPSLVVLGTGILLLATAVYFLVMSLDGGPSSDGFMTEAIFLGLLAVFSVGPGIWGVVTAIRCRRIADAAGLPKTEDILHHRSR